MSLFAFPAFHSTVVSFFVRITLRFSFNFQLMFITNALLSLFISQKSSFLVLLLFPNSYTDSENHIGGAGFG